MKLRTPYGTMQTKAGCDISRSLQFNNDLPQAFSAPPPTTQPVRLGNFIGSVAEGGSCNVLQLSLIPHCNGTHTEGVGHIAKEPLPLPWDNRTVFIPALLLTLTPAQGKDSQGTYEPAPQENDWIIGVAELARAIGAFSEFPTQALVVRTKMPEGVEPPAIPAYFGNDAISLITRAGIDHLLFDQPSIDRLDDGGLLSNHFLFWNVNRETREIDEQQSHKTITELITVPDSLEDGPYMLNLQYPAFALDAAPSRPVLFKLNTEH